MQCAYPVYWSIFPHFEVFKFTLDYVGALLKTCFYSWDYQIHCHFGCPLSFNFEYFPWDIDKFFILIIIELKIVLSIVCRSFTLDHIFPLQWLSYSHQIQLGFHKMCAFSLEIIKFLVILVLPLRFDLEYFPWDIEKFIFDFFSGLSLSQRHFNYHSSSRSTVSQLDGWGCLCFR